MIIRRLLSRTGVAVLAVSVALATAVPAQAAVPAPESVAAASRASRSVWRSRSPAAPTRATASPSSRPSKVPMAVMMACAPGKEGRTQQWVYTESGQLQVAMSKSVGGALAETGACLDTGADLVTPPADAPVLVLPCRDGDGQKWNYDEADGTFVNAANGLALSSLLGKGKSKQAQPTGIQSAAGSPTQGWSALPLPGLDILGAVLALVNALLASLGLALPLPIANAASSLLELVRGEDPGPEPDVGAAEADDAAGPALTKEHDAQERPAPTMSGPVAFPFGLGDVTRFPLLARQRRPSVTTGASPPAACQQWCQQWWCQPRRSSRRSPSMSVTSDPVIRSSTDATPPGHGLYLGCYVLSCNCELALTISQCLPPASNLTDRHLAAIRGLRTTITVPAVATGKSDNVFLRSAKSLHIVVSECQGGPALAALTPARSPPDATYLALVPAGRSRLGRHSSC